MIWGPFLLAVALGGLVSAALFFAYLWPQREPAEEEDPPRDRSYIDLLASDADHADPATADRQQPAYEEQQTPPPSVPA